MPRSHQLLSQRHFAPNWIRQFCTSSSRTGRPRWTFTGDGKKEKLQRQYWPLTHAAWLPVRSCASSRRVLKFIVFYFWFVELASLPPLIKKNQRHVKKCRSASLWCDRSLVSPPGSELQGWEFEACFSLNNSFRLMLNCMMLVRTVSEHFRKLAQTHAQNMDRLLMGLNLAPNHHQEPVKHLVLSLNCRWLPGYLLAVDIVWFRLIYISF